jgi:DNA-directed RNA polymerase specialized sigma24 family protein
MAREEKHLGKGNDLSPALGSFCDYLHWLARQQLDSRLHTKVDPSDIVQQTLLDAYQDRRQYRGCSDAKWPADCSASWPATSLT